MVLCNMIAFVFHDTLSYLMLICTVRVLYTYVPEIGNQGAC